MLDGRGQLRANPGLLVAITDNEGCQPRDERGGVNRRKYVPRYHPKNFAFDLRNESNSVVKGSEAGEPCEHYLWCGWIAQLAK